GGPAQELLDQSGKGACLPPLRPIPWMHPGHEIAECCSCELARRGKTDVGIAAKHDTNGLEMARHAPHGGKRNHPPIGGTDAEGRLGRVPMHEALACWSGLETLEKSVSKDGALCHGGCSSGK